MGKLLRKDLSVNDLTRKYLKIYNKKYFLKFFILKYIKIIFFLIFKKLFLKSAHQNNLKNTINILI